MNPSFWLENGMTPGKHVLVDCGYMADAEANFKALRPHISPRNFQRVGNDRLVARIPPRKVAAVLAAVPQIKEGVAGYCWCTHGFAPNVEAKGPSRLAGEASSAEGATSTVVLCGGDDDR